MSDLDEELDALGRKTRTEAEQRTDTDAALSQMLGRSGRNRAPFVVAAAAAILALVVGGALVLRNDGSQRVAGTGTGDPQGTPSTETTSSAPTTDVSGEPIGFELLNEFPSSLPPGSLFYAGAQDALSDQWLLTDTAEPEPEVDFEQMIVLSMTRSEPEKCPHSLVSLVLNGTELIPGFEPIREVGLCRTGPVNRTHVVAIDRAALPTTFTLVLPAAEIEGGNTEQRLEVTLDQNAASNPLTEIRTPPIPTGPDLQAPEPGQEITFNSVGDIGVHQKLDLSEVTPDEGGGPCGYWGPGELSHDGDEPLSGIATGAGTDTPRVLSIDVRRNPTYRTASGVGIGTKLATLQRVYGDDLLIDRIDPEQTPTDGLRAMYQDVAAVRNDDSALTFLLRYGVVESVKVSDAEFWGDDEGCA